MLLGQGLVFIAQCSEAISKLSNRLVKVTAGCHFTETEVEVKRVQAMAVLISGKRKEGN